MKKKICVILIAVLVAVLGTSTFFIIDHYKESNKQAALYGELAELVDAAAQTDAATEPAEQIPYSEEKMLLPELAELYQQNGDLVGWISIADTNINYPVMQSVNEPNFYLKHGFDKEYSDYGCPYVQEDCDVQEPSDNLVIYGHHMSNGSMFAHLEKFKSKDFWSEHRMITFNTLTDKQEYEIVAVFRTVVYTDSPEAFKFYRFIDAESANEFDDFIAKCKELSFYDTGVTAEYGDKLITLSTCEYSRNNSRLVVVAKRITEDGGADAAKTHAEATAEGERPNLSAFVPIMTTATALRWMTENPAPVCRASHTHFSASISAKLFCRQSLCWKRTFLAHALKSACPAVRRLSRRATKEILREVRSKSLQSSAGRVRKKKTGRVEK